ncbi:MAG: hypothetical protein H6712_12505 [Myxococcales bacterium]|nr:hypothetical protein [Myxococcales bacterium]MCB9714678.1 hypothetical protein [Myxococcales bacterium]
MPTDTMASGDDGESDDETTMTPSVGEDDDDELDVVARIPKPVESVLTTRTLDLPKTDPGGEGGRELLSRTQGAAHRGRDGGGRR